MYRDHGEISAKYTAFKHDTIFALKWWHKYRLYTNSFFTQAFNPYIIHISNNARGQKSVLPLPIYVPSCRESDALFRVCHAEGCSPCSGLLEATTILLGQCSLCPLFWLPLSVSASLNLSYIMISFSVLFLFFCSFFLVPVLHCTFICSSLWWILWDAYESNDRF